MRDSQTLRARRPGKTFLRLFGGGGGGFGTFSGSGVRRLLYMGIAIVRVDIFWACFCGARYI